MLSVVYWGKGGVEEVLLRTGKRRGDERSPLLEQPKHGSFCLVSYTNIPPHWGGRGTIDFSAHEWTLTSRHIM